MSRIVISCCIIVIISTACTCSRIVASDNTPSIDGELVETEIEIPAGGNLRLALGVEIGIGECRQIGRRCVLKRDNADKPTKVTIAPCCDYLICAGIGPFEILNVAGMAHHSDNLVSTGICTLSLDNKQGPKDKAKYQAYVKAL